MALRPKKLAQQLVAETVHDGEDDDERGNAEHDAHKRNDRDQRDAAFLAPGAQIAHGDHEFKRRKRPGTAQLRISHR